MEQASSAFSTGVPALAAIPQLAGNSRQGFGPVDGTMRWASDWVISSNTLGIKGSLYDGDAGSRSTGKERDTESGNDYFGARYYASTTGRFISPDWSAKIEPVPYAKLDDPQSLNLYAYVRNNPLIRIDADGHCWPQWLCTAAQSAFGTAVQLFNDGLQRANYVKAASQLSGPGASAARKSLQDSTYKKLSPIGQSLTDQARQSRADQLANKTPEQLAESAPRTNADVNALGEGSKGLGIAGIVLGAATVAVDTAQAPDGEKVQTAVKGTAGLGGSWGGAEIGAAVGAEGGPWGALAGSLVGGFFGQKAAEAVVSGAGAQEQNLEIQPFQVGNIPGEVY